jgi:hypothetical protein
MNATNIRVPSTVDADPPEVAEALEVARSLWDSGERGDAIRWVRRAAEAADDAGQNARVASLARAAADLEDLALAPSSPTSQTRPASRPAPPPPRSIPPPLPSKRTPPPPPVAPATKSAPQVKQTRIRVSVRTSARDATLFVVRPLAEGQAPPAGTREAVLLLNESESDEAKGSVA